MPLGFIFILNQGLPLTISLQRRVLRQKLMNSQCRFDQQSSSCVAGVSCAYLMTTLLYTYHTHRLWPCLWSVSVKGLCGKCSVYIVTPNEIFCVWTHCVHLQLISSSYETHQLLGPYSPYRPAGLVTAYIVPSAVSKDLDSHLYWGP